METRNIKDFLHLYLGCEVQVTTSSATFTGEMLGYYIDEWYEKEEKVSIQVLINRNTRTLFTYAGENVKPILRPLSDMTDEEALKVAMIALKRDNANGLRITRTPERNYVSIWYNQWLPMGDYQKAQWDECDLEICISDDFTIYNHAFYRKGNGTAVGNEPLYRQHEIATFLLSKGFDLFQLIEVGLAIDKTTLKQEA